MQNRLSAPDEPPLTDTAKHMFAEIMRKALLAIRWLCRKERSVQAGHLADVVHNMPVRLAEGTLDLDRLRIGFKGYHDRYPYPERSLFSYLALLDAIRGR